MPFARDRGTIATNPCEKGGRLHAADRTDKLWGEPEIAALLTVASEQIKLKLVLALWTGLRQGDLLRLLWSAYDGSRIRLRRSKTGRRIVMPAGCRSRRCWMPLNAAGRSS
jgi:integrase